MIPDPEGVRDYKTRLAQLKNNYDDFLIAKTKEHTNKIIVETIVEKMKANNFSSKIWMNTYLKDVSITGSRVKVLIKSEYTTASGFDVAIAREKGTKRHFIRPNTATVLSWFDQGVRLFSKGHWVSGIKSLRLIHKTIREKKPELQQTIEKEFEDWMVRVFTE